MSGLNHILNTSRSALLSHRYAMDVTSNNIANVNTPGFSRRRINPTEAVPEITKQGSLGSGVTIESTTRVRESFLDQQLRIANQSLGYATMDDQTLTQVESTFSALSDVSLGDAITGFFNSFQSLAQNPEDYGRRNAVLQSGNTMAQSFHTIANRITEIQQGIGDRVQTNVNMINKLTSDIAALNGKVIEGSAGGNDASDMKDQRDLKIDALSKLVRIQVNENANGSVNITIGGSQMVWQNQSTSLVKEISGNQITLRLGNATSTLAPVGGEVGSLINQYNVKLPDVLTQLDTMVSTITDRVNTIHRTSFGLGDPPLTGEDFFTGTTAASIDVNATIKADTRRIAASVDGAPGDNQSALAIAGVIDEQLFDGNTLTATGFYSRMISDIGLQMNSAKSDVTTQQLMVSQAENQRASISGVSLDEEMTNLIMWQRSYDAAARTIRTVDEMYQTILNMV
jgi:flagellar hook-associated protein 1 FlgK